jgi:hypothetical protein|tara:strand:- start:360 stop:545 length:186 start_codon:yes stop_codon:yes gene_type:complete
MAAAHVRVANATWLASRDTGKPDQIIPAPTTTWTINTVVATIDIILIILGLSLALIPKCNT